MTSSEQANTTQAKQRQFAPTHWTVVLAAQSNGEIAREALEKLCQTYWQPIYFFIRRQGKSPPDAQDLTQEFFARLLEKNYMAQVSREKGRFRSFLLAALKHFLANEWDKANAQKRGGGQVSIPINATAAETTYAVEIASQESAEKVYERRWALALLDQTMVKLRAEYVESGKATLFDGLKTTLTGDRNSIAYAEIAKRLGTTEGNIKVAVHRLRQRYREVLRAEIAQTVAGPEEIEQELRSLFAALAA